MATPEWSKSENERFERALAVYGNDAPGCWDRIAADVGGGKTADDVKRHYDLLVVDVHDIEAGGARTNSNRGDGSAPNEARRRGNEGNYFMRFERALLEYGPDEPDRWDRIAAAVGEGKTAGDLKRLYDELIEDIHIIDESNHNRVGTNRLLIIILLVVLFSFLCQLVMLKLRAE
ncbi:hypothetical protein ACQ4PT_029870 [Festuca glaucescens]